MKTSQRLTRSRDERSVVIYSSIKSVEVNIGCDLVPWLDAVLGKKQLACMSLTIFFSMSTTRLAFLPV